MEQMYSEIEPLMAAFAKSFPRNTGKVQATLDSTANSTATVSVYKNII
jgi:hypothetical protein